jgi:hypothetical protein
MTEQDGYNKWVRLFDAGHLTRPTYITFHVPMQGETKERWKVLCEQATIEKDPQKLLKLITEINELLMTKEGRLLKEQLPEKPDSP